MCCLHGCLICIYVYCVVRLVNARVLEEGQELLQANGDNFEISQLLFTDDTAQVADSKKLYRLMSEFGRIWERIKLS